MADTDNQDESLLAQDLKASSDHQKQATSSGQFNGTPKSAQELISSLSDWSTLNTGRGSNELVNDLLAETNLFNANRETYYNTLDRYECNPFVMAIVNIIIEHMFDDDENDSVAIEVHHDKPEYKEAVQEMFKEVQMGDFLDRNAESMIVHGELPCAMETVEGRGIVAISEKYAPGEIVTVYEGSDPIQYWRYPIHSARRSVQYRQRGGYAASVAAEPVDFHEVVVFKLPGKRLKLAVEERSMGSRRYKRDKKETNSFFVQASRSFIWPAIDKLQTLQLHDTAKTAMRLKQLSRPTLVHLQLPDSTGPKAALEYCKRFEKLLNSSSNQLENLIESGDIRGMISSMSGSNIKVIPQFAGGKGDLSRSDVDKDIRDELGNEDLETNKGYKIEILNILGIPVDMYFAEDGANRDLRNVARFYRKIKKINRSITRELAVMATNHIVHKFGTEDVSADDFRISLGSNSSIEALDAAEHVNIVIDNIDQMIKLQTTMQEANLLAQDDTLFDREKMMKFIKGQLSDSGTAGIADLFKEEEDLEDEETVDNDLPQLERPDGE